MVTVADPEGVQGVRSNLPLRQNYSIFMANFQKNQEKIANNQVQSTNQTSLCKFEPPTKKSWIRPCVKKLRNHSMAILYPNLCYNENCYKGTTLYLE